MTEDPLLKSLYARPGPKWSAEEAITVAEPSPYESAAGVARKLAAVYGVIALVPLIILFDTSAGSDPRSAAILLAPTAAALLHALLGHVTGKGHRGVCVALITVTALTALPSVWFIVGMVLNAAWVEPGAWAFVLMALALLVSHGHLVLCCVRCIRTWTSPRPTARGFSPILEPSPAPPPVDPLPRGSDGTATK